MADTAAKPNTGEWGNESANEGSYDPSLDDFIHSFSANRAKSPLMRLALLYRGHLKTLLVAAVFLIIKHCPTWILPIVTANVINVAADPAGHPLSELVLNLLIGTLFVAQNSGTTWLYTRFYAGITRSIELELRGALVRKLQQLSIRFHKEIQSGRLLSKIMRDVENLEIMLSQSFDTVITLTATLTAALIVTLRNDPPMVLFYLLTVPAAVVTLWAFRKPINASNADFRTEVEKTQAEVGEMLERIPVTRAYGLQDKEVRHMNTRLAAVMTAGYHLDQLNALFGATSWVVFQLFQLLCLGVTGILAWHGKITIGEVVLYQSYFGQIVGSVTSLVGLLPSFSKGLEAVNSISEVLDASDIEHTGQQPAPQPLAGAVEFNHVSYRYAPGERLILKDFTLKVPAGASVALVGGSGAGKSTVLNLLAGFGTPESGKITVDGIDLAALDLASYRAQIAVVPQNTILFSGTLRENLIYARPDATEAQIQTVIEQVGLGDLVAALPQGLDSSLAEHGGNLSGGQRQRISIARALLRAPRIIVFDEATSALDSESEKMVQCATEQLMHHCTTFMVAHRLSTIQNADCIAVVEDGCIVEQGGYAELMAQKGRFYRLKMLQS